VPVGTGDRISEILREEGVADVSVASNPEFLREGAAIADFKHPDRIVVGAEDAHAEDVLKEIYRPLFLNRAPILITGRRTAELTKYAANAFLAVKISFINEIADLCEAVDADVQDVARGIGLDNRIGPKFLHAGPGYGGSCFPKDTHALASFARAAGERMGIVEATIEANERQMERMVQKVVDAVGTPKGKTVAVLGLAFKPNTDDMRAAPSLTILPGLKKRGFKVVAFDPIAMPKAATMLEMKDVEMAKDAYEAARDAHAIVVLTEWNEFRTLDLAKLKRVMKQAVLCDLRNIYAPEEVEAAGWTHVGVGKGRPGQSARKRVVARRQAKSA
jgi:UDPglucose 6-dehydrogenase